MRELKIRRTDEDNTSILRVPFDIDKGTVRNDDKHRSSCLKARKKRKSKR